MAEAILVKPEEVQKLKGKKLREVLGLDYGKVSKAVSETWTRERREKIKAVAREVGDALAEKWETDPELSKIAGALNDEMFDKVSMPSIDRKRLKASRFKYHDSKTRRVWVIALPTVASIDFRHRLKTGTVKFGVGGFVAEYEKTTKGLQLVKVHCSGYDIEEIIKTIKTVKPDLFEKARNKMGMNLKTALQSLGFEV